ncbi:uncharacterized protein [Drosophila takahashii]|uniref:uncharacterized protein n=1 Tax=Drosophila takahashii TaxID=29030 RepID=UPI001CF7F59B|nr:4-coumarate--CoA ligase 3-like [Drosophila takahashii]
MADLPVTYDEKERIWSGGEFSNSLYKEDLSLGTIVFNTLRNSPKNVCQICDADGVSLTFEQTLTWAIRLAQFFKRKGLNHENVIGIAALNSTYIQPLGVGCLLNGTPFHAMNPALDEGTTSALCLKTKPAVIFCDDNVYEKVRSASINWEPEIYTITGKVEGVPSIEVLLDPTETEKNYQPEPLVKIGGQTVAILCSSGTTGLPKTICVSDRTLLSPINYSSDLVFYTPSGLDWLTGLLVFIVSITCGSTVIRSNKPVTPQYFVHLVKKYKISVALGPPPLISDLVSCPEVTAEAMESVRNLGYAGASISLATLQRARKIFRKAMISSTYALTECGIVTRNLTNSKISSVGRPYQGMKVRIVDELGQNLSHNEVGEIYAYSGLSWGGFYGDPEAASHFQDSEGWFHTGDLGNFDSENFLYIVDRKKEVLKHHGLQYWTPEIEDVIAELPQVRDVCVMGIYNEDVGDEAGALVVINEGSSITTKEIQDHVAKRLPVIRKQLHAGVQFTKKLPTNLNGKTLRKAAREEFLAKKQLESAQL